MPHIAVASRVSGRLPKWGPFDRLRGDAHVARLLFAIFLTLLAPFLGFFFAAFFAYHADQEGRDGIRNALIAVCGAAILMLYAAPLSIWGVLLGA